MVLGVLVTQTQNLLGKYNKLEKRRAAPHCLPSHPDPPAWLVSLDGDPSSRLPTPDRGSRGQEERAPKRGSSKDASRSRLSL